MNYTQYEKLKECAKDNNYVEWNSFRTKDAGRNLNLKFSNLSDLDLSNFDLSFANLKFTYFNKSNFTDTIFHNAVIGQKTKRDEILYTLFQVFISLFFPIVFFSLWDILAIPELDKNLMFVVVNSLFLFLTYCFFIGLPFKYSLFFSLSSFVTLTIYKFGPSKVESLLKVSTLPEFFNFFILIILITLTLFTLIFITEKITLGFFHFFNLGSGYAIIESNTGAIILFLIALFLLIEYIVNRFYKNSIIRNSLDFSYVKGYAPPSKELDSTKEQLQTLESRLEKIKVESKGSEVDRALQDQINILKSQIKKREAFTKRIEQSFKDLHKPNQYIGNLILLNVVLLVTFGLVFLLTLVFIFYLEYYLYEKIWLGQHKVDNVYLFYSPILVGVIIISLSLAQFNKRLKEISSLLERKRFISEIESTIRAFGNFYSDEDKNIEAYFSKTIDSLQDYYLKNIGKDILSKESDDSNSDSKLLDVLSKILGKN